MTVTARDREMALMLGDRPSNRARDWKKLMVVGLTLAGLAILVALYIGFSTGAWSGN